MNDVLGYEGKHVVVTGAFSGMGGTAAQILCDLGAVVTALDIKPTPAPVKTFLEVDLRDRSAIDDAVAAIGGPVHSVFSCAGLPGPPFENVDTMLVNFVGARHLVESLVPKMPEGSSIGMIASSAAVGWQQLLDLVRPLLDTAGFDEGKAWCEANPDAISLSAYVVSKWALNAYTASRGADLIKQGIRLNCINPGPTASPMMPAFHALAGKDLVDQAIGPIGRYSEPIEQGWPLVLLNSPRMSYVCGEQLWTDGGYLGAVTTGKLAGFDMSGAEVGK